MDRLESDLLVLMDTVGPLTGSQILKLLHIKMRAGGGG